MEDMKKIRQEFTFAATLYVESLSGVILVLRDKEWNDEHPQGVFGGRVQNYLQ